MVADAKISVLVDGRQRQCSAEEMRELVEGKTREAMNADARFERAEADRLGVFVSWGVVLIQARRHFREETFTQWLANGGCTHKQKAYSAIKVATEYADEHGHLDEPRFHEAIVAYNRECAAREGFRELPLRSRSIRTAEVLTGQRRGVADRRSGMSIPSTGGKMQSGAPDSISSPAPVGSDDPEALIAMLGGFGGAGIGTGESGGGLQTARHVTAAGFAAAESRTVRPGAPGRPAGEIHDDPAAAGESDGSTSPAYAGAGKVGSIEADRSIGRSRVPSGNAPWQMTMEESFAAAEKIAGRVIDRLRERSLSAEQVAKFAAFAEQLLNEAAGQEGEVA